MSAVASELLSSGPPEDRRPSRARRLLVIVLVLAVGVVPAVGFVRGRVERSGLGRLQAVWVQRGATHDALAVAVAAVQNAAGPQDQLAAGRAVAALQREDASELRRLARRAAGVRAYGPVRGLRSEVVADLAREERLLGAAAAAGSQVDPVLLVLGRPAERVDTDLSALRRRWPGPEPRAVPVRLLAGQPALRRFSRLLDRPLPLRLLVNGPDGPVVLDLTTGQMVRRPDVPNVTDGLVHGGYLWTAAPPQLRAVPLRGGPVRPVAAIATTVLAPGARPDQVWAGDGDSAVLVDVASRVRARVTAPVLVRGAVGSDLVIGEQFLSVWDPVRRRTVRRLPPCEELLAAAGTLVVLSSCPPGTGHPRVLHVFDVATGRDRVLRVPTGEYDIPAGNLSPDRQYLAMEARPADGLGRLLIADIDVGTVSAVPTPAASAVPAAPVWTPDSHRFFFTAGSLVGSPSASLWTYQVGDRTPTAIRYLRVGPVSPLAVLPDS